jgi:hypothetical protein
MKKTFLIIILPFLFSQFNLAQLKSITAYADYTNALTTRIEVTEADAVGGAVKVTFSLIDNFNIGLNCGYKLYSLSEPDVLNNWDWVFWTDRYYTKIISDLNADPNLAVEIGAVQKMDLIPLGIDFSYDLTLIENLKITPTVGGGVYFYNRRMFAVENWSKNFPDADYVFYYSYRNFAPPKKGNPLYINSSLIVQYKMFETLNIFSNVQYNYILETDGSFGYDSFPIGSELSIALGFSILY